LIQEKIVNICKPEVNEIEDLTLGRPLVDYVSAGSEPKLTDVAKCTVTRAKPKADISWIYDSPSKFPSSTPFQVMFPTFKNSKTSKIDLFRFTAGGCENF